MAAFVNTLPTTTLRAHIGRGAFVHPAFWFVSAALVIALILKAPLTQPAAIAMATIVMVGGGLPHGAYDIALLRRAVSLDRFVLALVVGGYLAIVVLMALLWTCLPLIALVLFLTIAAVHFGEDWPMLDRGLLRFAAGAAAIVAPTIGHQADVATLLVAMSDPRAAIVAKIITATAPVMLLVTAVGIAIAWRQESRQWAAAMTVCLILLVLLPPVAGFALFFVFLHTPRHLAQARAVLFDMTQVRWLATGALVSGAAILGWWAQQRLAPWQIDESLAAQAFQLLAAVAVPHLVLSRWLEQRLRQPEISQPIGPIEKAAAA